MGQPMQQQAPLPNTMQNYARVLVEHGYKEERDEFKTYLRALDDAWTQNYGPLRFGPRCADELHYQGVEAEGILALGEQAVVDAFSRTLELSREGARELARTFGYSPSLGAWMQDHLIGQKVLILNYDIDARGSAGSTSPAPARGEG